MSKEPNPSNSNVLRNFMRHVPQAVLIVTTEYDAAPWGLTISSATSASLEPPLFLICIDKKSQSLGAILKRRKFVVNLLLEDQMSISDIFAGRLKEKDKFKNVRYHLSRDGLPIIDGTLSHLECDVWKNYDGGDHELVLGKVTSGAIGSGSPIVYYDQSYSRVTGWEPASGVYPSF